MTTIKDVAKRARVSITSASYALNGNGTISPETRQRVLQAAEELNYHPNAFARHLKKNKTHTIGVFITSFGGSFYEEILEGILNAFMQTEYELLVCPQSRTKPKILTHRQVDGAIVFNSNIKNETILRLASRRFPVVVMERNLQAEYLLPLLLDNQQGTRDAFHHLYAQGLRRMAYIAGVADSFDNLERKQAFLDEANRHNLDVLCYQGDFTETSGYRAAQVLLNTHPLPEGVFCANDQMALGLLHAMEERGLKAPDDIAIIGFDDIQIARYVRPALTTVSASRYLWGARAATQLFELLENDRPFELERIPTTLIVRTSSKRT